MSETLPQAKVKVPLHLRLTAEDWEKWCKTLNSAELKVFTWIRCSDPYGDRDLKINCRVLGEKLGLHKATVAKALKSLDHRNLIEISFEEVSVTQKISNRRLTLLTKEESERNQEQEEEKQTVASRRRPLPPGDDRCLQATTVASRRRPLPPGDDQPPEPSPSTGSETPQTIQTYSDFIKTLSKGEREIFLEFGRKKAANLPHPPELPDKWIAANFTELHKQFLASPAGQEATLLTIAKQYDWENDPRLLDWLHKAYWVGYPWTQEDEAEREQRTAFLKWAQKTNAYEGRIKHEFA